MASPTTALSTRDPAFARLIFLTGSLFIAYLCVAMALPVTPVFVTHKLNLSNAFAGLAVGAAFISTILTRGGAGKFADHRGAKTALVRALLLYVAGSAICLAAGFLSQTPGIAFAMLLAGRLLLGLGESLVSVGATTWAIGIVGPERSGVAMALIGAALYGALGFGGPIGLMVFNHFGFSGVMVASMILPCLGLLAIWRMPAVPPHPQADRPPFWRVIGRIWLHGGVVCAQGIGFAAIGAFFALDFLRHGWSLAGLGLTAFGVGFVLVRLTLGQLPDRMGGANVAIASLVVELLGQVLIWVAPVPVVALIGAFLTGLGCSLIYPAMGREVVRLIEPQLRGTALGGFSMFQDLAYGLTGPIAGLLADRAGYGATFLVGAIAAVIGLALAICLRLGARVSPA